MFSHRYLKAAMKRLDGMPLGSSSLWGARAPKGYGMFPQSREKNNTLEVVPEFDYSPEEVAMAKRVRANFYERILNPNEIAFALRYSPVTLDIETFSSAWGDQNGIFTLPDDEDVKEEFDHTVTVVDHDEEGLWVDTGWSTWGPNQGHGYIPFEYLDKYFITAFAFIALDHMTKEPLQTLLLKDKIKLQGRKWYMDVYAVPSMRRDDRSLFNMEIRDAGGTIAAWTHLARNADRSVEILDLFVLPEYRRMGVGTFMFQNSQSLFKATRAHGYIASHDLIGNRDDQVREFLLSNNYLPHRDRSKFKDCRYRIEPL
jgi:GNAT superfamily N-acetyltransferase